MEEADLPNTPGPYKLDVLQDDWPLNHFDAVFSANTSHIMSWNQVVAMFDGVKSGLLLIYGPFNYSGRHTSASNRQFDQMLRQRDPNSGLRDFDDLDQLAAGAGLQLLDDVAMPANNRVLCWKKG